CRCRRRTTRYCGKWCSRRSQKDASMLERSCIKLYSNLGVCAHWLRPHQKRWTAAGGFAWPVGAGDGKGTIIGGLPKCAWSVWLEFDRSVQSWSFASSVPKRGRSVRIAVPTRTKRHHQAAVHTLWSPGTLSSRHKATVTYGFRNSANGWELKARYEARMG